MMPSGQPLPRSHRAAGLRHNNQRDATMFKIQVHLRSSEGWVDANTGERFATLEEAMARVESHYKAVCGADDAMLRIVEC